MAQVNQLLDRSAEELQTPWVSAVASGCSFVAELSLGPGSASSGYYLRPAQLQFAVVAAARSADVVALYLDLAFELAVLSEPSSLSFSSGQTAAGDFALSIPYP